MTILDSDSGSIVSQLILIMVLTLVNAFFASAEMAIVSVNKGKIKKLSAVGNKKALLLERLMDEPSNFLSTIQVGITLAGFLSSASAATGISHQLADWLNTYGIPYASQLAMFGVTILLSYFTLVFGELVPKRIALQRSESIALFSVNTIYFVSLIAKPFIHILSFSTSIILKLFGITKSDVEDKVSKEEIRALIYQSEQDGLINDDEKQMIDGVFEFDDTPAKTIMTPRKDTFMVNINDPINEILDRILEVNYSRVPVYEDHIDNIVGILYIHDVFVEARRVGFCNISLPSLLHQPYFVPETKKADDLFRALKERKNHMAILIDEYGGFSGIVTLEDLVEEIVGEIQDEYDQEEVAIRKIDARTFRVKCSLSINQINTQLPLHIPTGEYDTLNGYLITLLGSIPKDHVTLEIDNVEYKIVTVNHRRIEEVQIKFPVSA